MIGVCRSDFTIALPIPIIYLSYRWNNAGPSCLLWRLSFNSVTAASADGTGSTRFSPQIVSDWAYDEQSLASYGGFVDLWPVPPPSTTYLNACALLRHFVGTLTRPRVVCLISNEVQQAVKDAVRLNDASGGVEIVGSEGEGELSAGTEGYKQQAAAIKGAGAFRVLQFGNHHCVAVEQPHPGFFAYSPSIQPLLFHLLICCSALVCTHDISLCDEANDLIRYCWAKLTGSPGQSIRWPNRNLGTGASEPGCGRAPETRTSPWTR